MEAKGSSEGEVPDVGASAEQLIIVGVEGQLRLVKKGPHRMWCKTGTLGSDKTRYRDVIVIPGSGYSLSAERGHVKEGVHMTLSGKRARFYCRLLPDDALTRGELAHLDAAIKIAEEKVAAAKRARQEFLESCARRAKRVPVPTQPPKPKES